jgi:pimeloyl-ACP methyl ester carboxylesterase
MAGCIYDLAQLIHQQRLAPVTIVAHSLGGNIALRYAGIYPETVAKLAAIEGLGPPPSPSPLDRTGGRVPMPGQTTAPSLAESSSVMKQMPHLVER